MEELEKNIAIVMQSGKMCGPKISDIAKKLGTSPATVHRKLREMENAGIVQGYFAHLDPKKLGKPLTAFMRIQFGYPAGKKITHEEFIQQYIDYFSKLKEVQEIHIPTGTWDLIIKVKIKDITEQYKFVSEKAMPLGNILRMETFLLSMKTIKEGTYIEPSIE